MENGLRNALSGIFYVPSCLIVKNRTMRLMLYMLFGLVVADGLITEFLVTNGHAVELNPFLRSWVGQDLFLMIKVSGAFLATSLLWIRHNAKPKPTYTIAAVFLIFYIIIVFWNLLVFLIT